ncbi:tripartite tricarboxylate transporter family receptor [Bordetella bronchiseptica MBORD675]|uniref:Bug family tripartite tricarboxylate transporter substrate binding protein n=1 Tax=Bordetella bronchiseptica TaxID=518 RepID=UPI00028FB69E|nr:tripartite tricarboxylate transporter substrate binding protein [Bordetella bronchiseptica]KDC22715.1 tripartite tricarboxylate transporter family receptor [Bordetella bronchiseptica F-1]KDC31305.1 tripartite tricarboxylate transporter family receptor [Bordetella bronchiseptica F2]KDC99616.1 tripartite tricarboxylate transporter family receptor [Bordetella bronchiseptica MBORD675]RSB98548.1 tripartite tricarboxylate transporter substrate binding protein [Bordetella bronchiseptica]RSC07611.1
MRSISLHLRRALAVLGLAGIAAAAPLHAAETWPDRPVRLIVPYPAGGGVDFAARLIASDLSKQTGQNFIVENRTGAAGTIGAQAVVQSTADGNTVLFASPAEVLVSRIAGQKTSYDAGKDLQPVTLAGETPLAVVVNPAVPARTLAELVALARKDPSAISYGTPGTGSTMQFAGEALNLAAGIKMLHVPYRGAAPAIADLLGNQIPVAIVGVPPLVAHHKSGKLRILAVTGSQRIAALPDVPTVAEELGVADYRYTNWFGVYVPGNTPAAVGDRLAALIHASVYRDAIKAQLAEQGVEPIGNTTPEFVRFLAGEKARYETVQRKSGIQMD